MSTPFTYFTCVSSATPLPSSLSSVPLTPSEILPQLCLTSGHVIILINSSDPLGTNTSIREHAHDIRNFISQSLLKVHCIWVNPPLQSDDDSSSDSDDEDQNFTFFKSLLGADCCMRCESFALLSVLKRITMSPHDPSTLPPKPPKSEPSPPSTLSDAFLQTYLQTHISIKTSQALLKLAKNEIHRRRTLSLSGSRVLPKNEVIKGSLTLGSAVPVKAEFDDGDVQNWTGEEKEMYYDLRHEAMRQVTVKRKKVNVDDDEDDDAEVKKQKMTAEEDGEDDVEIVKPSPKPTPEIIELLEDSDSDDIAVASYLSVADLIDPYSKRIYFPNPNFTSLRAFNKFVRPSRIPKETAEWVQLHSAKKSTASSVTYDAYLHILHSSSTSPETKGSEILKLAKSRNETTGKWLVFTSDVDSLWKDISEKCADGVLGNSCKISVGSEKGLACVYVDDFTDRRNVKRVLENLEGVGGRVAGFKTDVFTTLGINSGNEWKISPVCLYKVVEAQGWNFEEEEEEEEVELITTTTKEPKVEKMKVKEKVVIETPIVSAMTPTPRPPSPTSNEAPRPPMLIKKEGPKETAKNLSSPPASPSPASPSPASPPAASSSGLIVSKHAGGNSYLKPLKQGLDELKRFSRLSEIQSTYFDPINVDFLEPLPDSNNENPGRPYVISQGKNYPAKPPKITVRPRNPPNPTLPSNSDLADLYVQLLTSIKLAKSRLNSMKFILTTTCENQGWNFPEGTIHVGQGTDEMFKFLYHVKGSCYEALPEEIKDLLMKEWRVLAIGERSGREMWRVSGKSGVERARGKKSTLVSAVVAVGEEDNEWMFEEDQIGEEEEVGEEEEEEENEDL